MRTLGMEVNPRSLWKLIEPIHALTYFAPEAAKAFSEVELRGFWRGYFASRAAPLGPVEAAPVIALFYGFETGFVERAIPSVWDLCSPAEAIQARQAGAAKALDTAWSRAADSTSDTTRSLARAAEILTPACQTAGRDRRPLGAANASLAWPEGPSQRLWHAATVLREHRGDGHVCALVANDLGPCESTILRSACSGTSLDWITAVRGWEHGDWNEAALRLTDRRLLTIRVGPAPAGSDSGPAGTTLPNKTTVVATTEGQELHQHVEELTDHLAQGPFQDLANSFGELEAILAPLVAELSRSKVIPYPNPIGVPRPDQAPGPT